MLCCCSYGKHQVLMQLLRLKSVNKLQIILQHLTVEQWSKKASFKHSLVAWLHHIPPSLVITSRASLVVLVLQPCSLVNVVTVRHQTSEFVAVFRLHHKHSIDVHVAYCCRWNGVVCLCWSRSWGLWKWLDRSRCHLEGRLVWDQGTM